MAESANLSWAADTVSLFFASKDRIDGKGGFCGERQASFIELYQLPREGGGRIHKAPAKAKNRPEGMQGAWKKITVSLSETDLEDAEHDGEGAVFAVHILKSGSKTATGGRDLLVSGQLRVPMDNRADKFRLELFENKWYDCEKLKNSWVRKEPPLDAPTWVHFEDTFDDDVENESSNISCRVSINRGLFGLINGDNDGKITFDELKKYAEKQQGFPMDNKTAQWLEGAWATHHEKAGNDGLDRDEFREFLMEVRQAQSHMATGAGRLPGSKYTITEAEIQGSTTKEELEDVVYQNKDRGGKGRNLMLKDWDYIETAAGFGLVDEEYKDYMSEKFTGIPKLDSLWKEIDFNDAAALKDSKSAIHNFLRAFCKKTEASNKSICPPVQLVNQYVEFDPEDDKQEEREWLADQILKFNRRLLINIACTEPEPGITQLSVFEDAPQPKKGSERWAQNKEDNDEDTSSYLPLAKYPRWRKEVMNRLYDKKKKKFILLITTPSEFWKDEGKQEGSRKVYYSNSSKGITCKLWNPKKDKYTTETDWTSINKLAQLDADRDDHGVPKTRDGKLQGKSLEMLRPILHREEWSFCHKDGPPDLQALFAPETPEGKELQPDGLEFNNPVIENADALEVVPEREVKKGEEPKRHHQKRPPLFPKWSKSQIKDKSKVDKTPSDKQLERLEVLMKLSTYDKRFSNEGQSDSPGFLNRKFNDSLCCFLFIAFMGALLVANYVIAQDGGSDVKGLFRPIDYEGNSCGTSAAVQDKPKLVFPKLAEDLASAYMDGAQLLSNLNADNLEESAGQLDLTGVLYGICVPDCPVRGQPVCTYAAELELDNKYSTDAAAKAAKRHTMADSRDRCWYIDVNLDSKFDRCVFFDIGKAHTDYTCIETNFTDPSAPKIRSPIDIVGLHGKQVEYTVNQKCKTGVVEESIIAVRQFQGTSGVSDVLSGVVSIFFNLKHDFENAQSLVIFSGLILSCGLSFIFVTLVSQIAGFLIWTVLFMCWIFQLLLLTLLAAQAGFIDLNKLHELAGNTTLTQDVGGMSDGLMAEMDVSASSSIPKEFAVYGTYGICGVAILYPLTVFALRNQIMLATALMMEAGRTLRKMPVLLVSTRTLESSDQQVFPVFQFAFNLVLVLSFALMATLAYSLKTESAASFNMNNLATSQESQINLTLFMYAFGLIWCLELVKAIGVMTVAGAVGTDYWIPKDTATDFLPLLPTFPALYRAIRYHLGSAIFGALILAIIRMIRYVLMYIDSKAAELQQRSFAMKVFFHVLHCCLYCFEKCVRFLSYSTYILIAVEGGGFCQSAWKSFKLLFTNSLRVATAQVLTTTIISLSSIGIVGACTAFCFMALRNLSRYSIEGDMYVEYQFIPVGFVFVFAYVVVYSFMSVYDTAVQTLLLSFCLDEDNFKKGKYESKTDLITGKPDPRMFCVVNDKVELIKLVSGSAASHEENANDTLKQKRRKDRFHKASQ